MSDSFAAAIANSVLPSYLVQLQDTPSHVSARIRKERIKSIKRKKSEDVTASKRIVVKDGVTMCVESRGTGFYSK